MDNRPRTIGRNPAPVQQDADGNYQVTLGTVNAIAMDGTFLKGKLPIVQDQMHYLKHHFLGEYNWERHLHWVNYGNGEKLYDRSQVIMKPLYQLLDSKVTSLPDGRIVIDGLIKPLDPLAMTNLILVDGGMYFSMRSLYSPEGETRKLHTILSFDLLPKHRVPL